MRLLLLVPTGVIELVRVRLVRTVALAGMSLPDNDVDELHAVAVEAIQLLHRQNSAAGQRSRVADEVDEHRLPAQVAKPQPFSLRRRQLEVRRVSTRQHTVGARGADQFGGHVRACGSAGS